jgi:polyisoprenoid-binding protein YceI
MVKVLAPFVVALAIAAPAWAAEPIAFRFDETGNHITYEAVQNHATVTGAFEDFSGEVRFHPDALDSSHARVEVRITSVDTSYDEVTSTLQTAEWFDVASHPTAVFEAANFAALGDNRYTANGTLTMKGISQPITLTFTLDDFSETIASIHGEAVLKRTAYTIGWEDTSAVEDNVKVLVNITAKAAEE